MKSCTSTVRLWAGRYFQCLQTTLRSNARSVLSRFCASHSQTERHCRSSLLRLPRLARKQQVSGKRMPERPQSKCATFEVLPLVPRRRDCTDPVDIACSWCANPSLSVRCSNRDQVTLLVTDTPGSAAVAGGPDARTKGRARSTPHDMRKARQVLWKTACTTSDKPIPSQARSHPRPPMAREHGPVALTASADTNAFTTCRDLYVRVRAERPSWIDAVLDGALVSPIAHCTTPTREAAVFAPDQEQLHER